MGREWGIIIVILAFLLVVGPYLTYAPRSVTSIEAVVINGSSIRVETATSLMKQAKGLSGRKSLGAREGMLFLYAKPGFYSFWMKDMTFPIDIIWISEEYEVVDITSNIQPDSFPRTFAPQKASQYVLEVNAGVAGNIAHVGDKVTFQYAN